MAPPLLEQSIDVRVPRDFVWRQRTDVRTWHDPPAQFRLPGPFQDGAVGKTVVPGEPPVTWRVRNVRAPEAFTVEVPVEDAVVAFEWTFQALGPSDTRMTQRVAITGEHAAAYEDGVRSAFGATLPQGMARIARSLEDEFRKTTDRSHE